MLVTLFIKLNKSQTKAIIFSTLQTIVTHESLTKTIEKNQRIN